jgi:prepilin-type N-terminal cleavage/methylation domain-containing protein
MRLRIAGFTLVELMVTLAVLSILAVLSVPTFMDFRQRTVLRGAGEQLVTVWGDARFEALRRDSMVKVGLRTTSAGAMCIGAATTTDPADDTACDCFTSGACNVSAYPADPAEWRRVVSVGQPTLGNTDTDDDGVAVIDPKRGGLTDRADAGGISLKAPIGGGVDYRLNMVVDGNGRAVLCEPAAAPSKLPEYRGRRC